MRRPLVVAAVEMREARVGPTDLAAVDPGAAVVRPAPRLRMRWEPAAVVPVAASARALLGEWKRGRLGRHRAHAEDIPGPRPLPMHGFAAICGVMRPSCLVCPAVQGAREAWSVRYRIPLTMIPPVTGVAVAIVLWGETA